MTNALISNSNASTQNVSPVVNDTIDVTEVNLPHAIITEVLLKNGKTAQVITLFNQKEYKDKNVSEMIKIQSNSWKGLFQKIIAFREVVSYINNIYNNSKK